MFCLNNGEHTSEQTIRSILAQKECIVELVIVKGRSEIDAHSRLYSLSNQICREFDLTVKIDSDMTIVTDDLFQRLFSFMGECSPKSWFVAPIFDSFLERPIYGIHFWGPKVKFHRPRDEIFPDRLPPKRGRKIRLCLKGLLPVNHLQNASPEQLASFLVRRLRKVLLGARGESAFWSLFLEEVPDPSGGPDVSFQTLRAEALNQFESVISDPNKAVELILNKVQSGKSEAVPKDLLEIWSSPSAALFRDAHADEGKCNSILLARMRRVGAKIRPTQTCNHSACGRIADLFTTN